MRLTGSDGIRGESPRKNVIRQDGLQECRVGGHGRGDVGEGSVVGRQKGVLAGCKPAEESLTVGIGGQ